VTIWNGLYGCIQENQSTLLIQPVLEWYVRDALDPSCPPTPQWTATPWYLWDNPKIFVNGSYIDFIHTPRLKGINPGDKIRGTILINTVDCDTKATINDITGTAGSTTLCLTQYTTVNGTIIPDKRLEHDLYATVMLEGWTSQTGSSDNLPSPVTFSNFILTDQDGHNLLPTTPMHTYIDTEYWNQYTFIGYENLTVFNRWPKDITLVNNLFTCNRWSRFNHRPVP
jgi:hypothetical protein